MFAALQRLRREAEQGKAQAQAELGWRYDIGEGVEQDYSQAVKLYRKAAEQGVSFAQFNLGLYYKNGWGVEQDSSQALKWFCRAAEQGHKDAFSFIGFLVLISDAQKQFCLYWFCPLPNGKYHLHR